MRRDKKTPTMFRSSLWLDEDDTLKLTALILLSSERVEEQRETKVMRQLIRAQYAKLFEDREPGAVIAELKKIAEERGCTESVYINALIHEVEQHTEPQGE